jgi:hypothetical protein
MQCDVMWRGVRILDDVVVMRCPRRWFTAPVCRCRCTCHVPSLSLSTVSVSATLTRRHALRAAFVAVPGVKRSVAVQCDEVQHVPQSVQTEPLFSIDTAPPMAFAERTVVPSGDSLARAVASRAPLVDTERAAAAPPSGGATSVHQPAHQAASMGVHPRSRSTQQSSSSRGSPPVVPSDGVSRRDSGTSHSHTHTHVQQRTTSVVASRASSEPAAPAAAPSSSAAATPSSPKETQLQRSYRELVVNGGACVPVSIHASFSLAVASLPTSRNSPLPYFRACFRACLLASFFPSFLSSFLSLTICLTR